MSEQKQETKRKIARIDLNSKSWKSFLVLLAVFLTFAGPTYVVYVLINFLEIDYAISMLSGFALFIIGLALIRYLIRKKILS